MGLCHGARIVDEVQLWAFRNVGDLDSALPPIPKAIWGTVVCTYQKKIARAASLRVRDGFPPADPVSDNTRHQLRDYERSSVSKIACLRCRWNVSLSVKLPNMPFLSLLVPYRLPLGVSAAVALRERMMTGNMGLQVQ
jgi:hypothetical protein